MTRTYDWVTRLKGFSANLAIKTSTRLLQLQELTVWIDVDKTTYTLDTIIEVLDAQGNLLARSVNSTDEQSTLALSRHLMLLAMDQYGH